MATEPGNPFAMNQQEQILREIRDELKQTRQTSPTGASGGSRPSPGFIAAQQTADRMIAGEWAQLGWANAYSSSIKSSLANDLMGTMGLRAAPQTMWQREYEQMSRAMLTDRITSFPADVLMPGFGRRSRDMGAQLYQLSSRFNRGGDGLDTNFHGVMSMARDIQLGAATDMRLSGKDYNSILSTSANAGQFDFASGTGDVKAIFGELKSAVADLTKSLRVGAGEVSQTMGAFRQFGMVDIADQGRAAAQMGNAARVAGLSTPEMAGISRAGMESGAQYGFGAGGSAQLAQNLAMAARSGSRSGLLSGSLMAAAGGVQGMTQLQQAAIDRFTSTPDAYYAQLGLAAGDTGGMISNLVAGISQTGGTLGGIVSAESQRQEFMSNLTGAQRQRGFNSYINQQLGLLGIDPAGSSAQSYAAIMLRSHMGEAAGNAYAAQNWSDAGRRQQYSNAMRMEMQVDQQAAQRGEQMRMENETMTGRMRQVTGASGMWLGQMSRWGGEQLDWMSRGFGGRFEGMNNSFQNAHAQTAFAGDDNISASAFMAATSVGSVTAPKTLHIGRTVSTGRAIAGDVLRYGGAAVGASAGFLTGAFASGGLLAVGGTVAGGIGGYQAGNAIASAAFGGGPITLEDEAAANYMAVAGSSTGNITERAMSISMGKQDASGRPTLGLLQKIVSHPNYRILMKMSDSRDPMSDENSVAAARLIKEISTEGTGGGATPEDVMGVLRAGGFAADMAASYNYASAADNAYTKQFSRLMDGVQSDGHVLASAEVSDGVKQYLQANTQAERHAAQTRLRASGILSHSLIGSGGTDFGLVGRLHAAAQDPENRKALIEGAGQLSASLSNDAVNRRFNAFNRYAKSLVVDSTTAGTEAYSRIGELTKADPKALANLMLSQDPENTGLQQTLIRNEGAGGVMDKLHRLGAIDDLMNASQDKSISALTGLTPDAIESIRASARVDATGTPRDKPGMQLAMRAGLVGQLTATSVEVRKASDPVNIAISNMLVAAKILDKIAVHLKISPG